MAAYISFCRLCRMDQARTDSLGEAAFSRGFRLIIEQKSAQNSLIEIYLSKKLLVLKIRLEM